MKAKHAEIYQKYREASSHERIEACRNDLQLFSLLYFNKYHTHDIPTFHEKMYQDAMNPKIAGLLWIMFRESAKTSIARMKIIHAITYKTSNFIIWTSFDEKKAGANLHSIALELQTNPLLNEDFGQLFYEPNMDGDTLTDEYAITTGTPVVRRFSQKKSIKEFITTNKVKVKAYSTGMSIRGETFGQYRPELIILDDIETMKTAVSSARTEQVINYIDEMLYGAAAYAKFFVLGNRITYNGSIQYLEDKVTNKPNWRVHDVAVIDPITNELTWPDKYVRTDAEKEVWDKKYEDNPIFDEEGFPVRKVVFSLQEKQADGLSQYNREFLNKPITEDEREFLMKWLQKTFRDEDLDKLTRNRYIAIDVADSKARAKADPDYTGTVIVDVDQNDNWYIQHASQRRFNAPELVDWIFYLWQEYQPTKIGVEKKSFEDQLKPYLKEKSEQTKVFPVVVELKHGGVQKEDRIRGALQGRFQVGKIYFKEQAKDDTDKLKMQLYDFPKAKHEDILDGLAYINSIYARPYFGSLTDHMSALDKEFFENKKRQKATPTVRRAISVL
jgi:phage terminase large subunit-like protein